MISMMERGQGFMKNGWKRGIRGLAILAGLGAAWLAAGSRFKPPGQILRMYRHPIGLMTKSCGQKPTA